MKLLSGIIMGALLASGVFYYLSKTNKEKESSAFISVIDSSKAVPMSMNQPKPESDNNRLIIKSSGAVTFLLVDNNEINYYKGVFDGNLYKTDYIKVRGLIKKWNSEINPVDLMFIIKSDKGSTFKNVIDILDEMTINKIPPGHYAETEITEAEINSINILKKSKNG